MKCVATRLLSVLAFSTSLAIAGIAQDKPALPVTNDPRYAGSFQSSQVQSARPMMSSLSFADSHGSSSVDIVTHWCHETGMRVMSVPQNIRRGPKASKTRTTGPPAVPTHSAPVMS